MPNCQNITQRPREEQSPNDPPPPWGRMCPSTHRYIVTGATFFFGAVDYSQVTVPALGRGGGGGRMDGWLELCGGRLPGTLLNVPTSYTEFFFGGGCRGEGGGGALERTVGRRQQLHRFRKIKQRSPSQGDVWLVLPHKTQLRPAPLPPTRMRNRADHLQMAWQNWPRAHAHKRCGGVLGIVQGCCWLPKIEA